MQALAVCRVPDRPSINAALAMTTGSPQPPRLTPGVVTEPERRRGPRPYQAQPCADPLLQSKAPGTRVSARSCDPTAARWLEATAALRPGFSTHGAHTAHPHPERGSTRPPSHCGSWILSVESVPRVLCGWFVVFYLECVGYTLSLWLHEFLPLAPERKEAPSPSLHLTPGSTLPRKHKSQAPPPPSRPAPLRVTGTEDASICLVHHLRVP